MEFYFELTDAEMTKIVLIEVDNTTKYAMESGSMI